MILSDSRMSVAVQVCVIINKLIEMPIDSGICYH